MPLSGEQPVSRSQREELPPDGVDDMTQLSSLDEASMLDNLSVRHGQRLIYTYTGSILISVNPYADLPLYTPEMVRYYQGARLGTLPPHVYALADHAYRSFLLSRKSQGILISGESGAGKTETAKHILKYLVATSNQGAPVEQKLLESNPLLEAFGNATTVANNNSSRFGKFVAVHLDASGHIVGAQLQQYLLEKSRVVQKAPGERNFHVFYQLFHQSQAARSALGLKSTPSEHTYLANDTGASSVDDAAGLAATLRAMEVLGISDADREVLFRVLAAVLHLGDIEFLQTRQEEAQIAGADAQASLGRVAKLLGLDEGRLVDALVKRTISAAGESYTIPLKAAQAVESRDALAKALYRGVFDWLVTQINASLAASAQQPLASTKFISVLDIFGFEDIPHNSLEQLCINFANEKLQDFFTRHILEGEQQEYLAEHIPWTSVPFDDNKKVLSLIERKHVGLISLLDEQCALPHPTVDSLVNKLVQQHKETECFSKPKLQAHAFTIAHYAGAVTYGAADFIDKNRDTIFKDLLELLLSSSAPLVAALGTLLTGATTGAAGKRTVLSQFRGQLQSLVATLEETQTHYVRCIKPNSRKSDVDFDADMVLRQLRYTGMVAAVSIRSKAGFSVRLPFAEFARRYAFLGLETPPDKDEIRRALERVEGVSMEKVALGITKVFLDAAVQERLDGMRETMLESSSTRIQAFFRGVSQRRRFRATRSAVVVIQTWTRRWLAQRALARALRAAVLAQALVRRWLARRVARAERSARKIQAVARGHQARRAAHKERQCVIAVQTEARGWLARRRVAEKREERRIAEEKAAAERAAAEKAAAEKAAAEKAAAEKAAAEKAAAEKAAAEKAAAEKAAAEKAAAEKAAAEKAAAEKAAAEKAAAEKEAAEKAAAEKAAAEKAAAEKAAAEKAAAEKTAAEKAAAEKTAAEKEAAETVKQAAEKEDPIDKLKVAEAVTPTSSQGTQEAERKWREAEESMQAERELLKRMSHRLSSRKAPALSTPSDDEDDLDDDQEWAAAQDAIDRLLDECSEPPPQVLSFIATRPGGSSGRVRSVSIVADVLMAAADADRERSITGTTVNSNDVPQQPDSADTTEADASPRRVEMTDDEQRAWMEAIEKEESRRWNVVKRESKRMSRIFKDSEIPALPPSRDSGTIKSGADAGKKSPPPLKRPVSFAESDDLFGSHVRIADVPFVVVKMIDRMQTLGLHAEGLFRLAASHSAAGRLGKQLAKGNYKALLSCDDVHVVASVFKRYFRAMPEPLLTHMLFDDFQAVAKLKSTERVQTLTILIAHLPPPNRDLLQALLSFLSRVSDVSAQNRMTAKNLGIVFAPCILRPASEAPEHFLAHVESSAKLVEMLIDNQLLLFPDAIILPSAPDSQGLLSSMRRAPRRLLSLGRNQGKRIAKKLG